MNRDRLAREISGYTLETLYGVRNWLESQIINLARNKENNMFALQMAVVRFAMRRHGKKLVALGIVLVLVNRFHQWVYKPLVGAYFIDLFKQTSGRKAPGVYLIKVSDLGVQFEKIADLKWSVDQKFIVLWGGKRLLPRYINLRDELPGGG